MIFLDPRILVFGLVVSLFSAAVNALRPGQIVFFGFGVVSSKHIHVMGYKDLNTSRGRV